MSEEPIEMEIDSSPQSAFATPPKSPTKLHRRHRLALHDAIALGEFESGIWLEDEPSAPELDRLPVIMRILEASRPLASLSSRMTFLWGEQEKGAAADNEDKSMDLNVNQDAAADPDIQRLVERLEERAAIYAASEGIDIVTNHLVPMCCVKRTKIAKMKHLEQLREIVDYKTLGQQARKSKMKKKSGHFAKKTAAANDESDQEMDEDDLSDVVVMQDATRQTREATTHDEISTLPLQLHKEDSMEEAVLKTICGLAQLMVEAADTAASAAATALTNSKDDTSDNVSLQQKLSDSILAQPRSKDIMGNDLGSMVVAIMHHAPVIKHKDLATALCRAAFPQSSLLIGRMGANCPAAVSCLLRGCIDAYQVYGAKNHAIADTERNGVEALATLSDREASRVRTVLHVSDCMLDLQLQLALGQSPLEAALMIINELSRPETATNGSDNTAATTFERQETAAEAPDGDEVHNSRHSLQRLLTERTALLVECITVLTKFLAQRRMDSAMIYHGDVVITLRALCLLFYRITTGAPVTPRDTGPSASENSSMELAVESCLSEVQAWIASIKILVNGREGAVEETSHFDLSFSLLVLLSLCQLCNTKSMIGTESFLFEKSLTNLREALIGNVSHYSNGFLARLAFAIRQRSCDIFQEILLDGAPNSMDMSHRESLDEAYRYVAITCESELNFIIEQGTDESSFIADPQVALGLLDDIQSNPESCTLSFDRAICLLRVVVDNAEHALSFLKSSFVPAFIERATAMSLATNHRLPLVSPLQIEALAKQLVHPDVVLNDDVAHFLLCLLYCIAFTDAVGNRNAPFVFDPRNLPLRQIRLFCEKIAKEDISDQARNMIINKIDIMCPEVEKQQAGLAVTSRSKFCLQPASSTDISSTKRNLLSVLRDSLQDSESDACGRASERAFIAARPLLSEADLCTCVVSAFLAEPHLPLRFVTYAACCRDQLALLKCTMKVWERDGLRRIALWTLTSLTEANNYIVRDMAPTETSAKEFLSARDVILLRTLIVVSANYSGYCSMSQSLIRKNIAKNRGLLTMLLRQGLSESAIDWIVEWVPEAFEDADCLATLLTDRCTITPSERLVVADAILRICVAHGHRRPLETKSLAYAALSHLIASFFIIMGPVGVPVNVIRGPGGNGANATTVSRRAAFRMLEAMQKVSAYRSSLKNECMLALQKLSGLCKGESMVSGLPISVANRQKVFLKQLAQEINKTSIALGGGPFY
ncbi:hypothetical protein MPSEU_000332800 [Mayamaea pseudoterrestris]|nr:hypothetical protein MPSEU_000332800 [Mayamaea pseudoterrestris]